MDFIRIGGYLFFLKKRNLKKEIVIKRFLKKKKKKKKKENEKRKTFALQLKPFGNEVKVMKPIDMVLFLSW